MYKDVQNRVLTKAVHRTSQRPLEIKEYYQSLYSGRYVPLVSRGELQARYHSHDEFIIIFSRLAVINLDALTIPHAHPCDTHMASSLSLVFLRTQFRLPVLLNKLSNLFLVGFVVCYDELFEVNLFFLTPFDPCIWCYL